MSESLLNTGEAQTTETTQVNPQITDAVTQAAPAQTQERPEWLPEKYKTPEELAKAYKELEGKLGTRDEELRKKLVEELQAEAYKDRPASSGEYQLPDFVDDAEALNSDLLKWWADQAFENGYSQSEFEQGIEIYMKSMPAPPDLEAEAKKLGDNANQRIQAASMFASKFFPPETLPAIERLCETSEGIIALEVMMDAMKDGSFAQTANPTSGTSESDLREMMKDDRYWNPTHRDPAFVKKVDEGFKKLYG